MEIAAQRKELVDKHKGSKLVERDNFNLFLISFGSVVGFVITEIKNMKLKEKADNFSVIDQLQKLLPLTIEKVSKATTSVMASLIFY